MEDEIKKNMEHETETGAVYSFRDRLQDISTVYFLSPYKNIYTYIYI